MMEDWAVAVHQTSGLEIATAVHLVTKRVYRICAPRQDVRGADGEHGMARRVLVSTLRWIERGSPSR